MKSRIIDSNNNKKNIIKNQDILLSLIYNCILETVCNNRLARHRVANKIKFISKL